MSPLLSVRNLRVSFPTRSGTFDAVRGVSFDLGRERLGVVGESGSGKSMTGRAILGLVRPPGRVTADRMELDGQPILNLPEHQMRALRGARISMVMQDPKFSLNPVMTIGRQITEGYRLHTRTTSQAARDKAQSDADAQHREALAIANTERQAQAAQTTKQLLDLLEQNTRLTEMTKQLTEHIESLTSEMHEHFVRKT